MTNYGKNTQSLSCDEGNTNVTGHSYSQACETFDAVRLRSKLIFGNDSAVREKIRIKRLDNFVHNCT